MRTNRELLLCLGVSIFGVLTLSPALFGQAAKSAEVTIPVPTDWSHHSLIFSRPATIEQAKRVQQDPRYWQQRYRTQLPAMVPGVQSRDALTVEHTPIQIMKVPPPKKKKGLWEESLGAGGSVGAGNYPAKFSFLSDTANCGTATQPDFVVYSTGVLGSATQASIVAYDNLYTGCTGTVPSNYWAYNTGGQILTSPVYSADGKQVAFVQTDAGFGTLVLLKWAASTTESVGGPVTLLPESAALYAACPTAPCMTTASLTDPGDLSADDTTSSVYYDYSGDAAYVGDSLGLLHKFSPVFKGTLAEVTTGGWPVQVNPHNPNVLSDPVHDSVSGNVFVGDAGGYLYAVDPAATVTISGKLDFGVGIVQGPVVDSTFGLVYVFASSDGSGSCIGGADCTGVYELSTSFLAGTTGLEVAVGTSTPSGTDPNPLYIGAFDSTYLNSVDGSGNLYVCGNTGGPPIIYQIAIGSGTLGTVTAGPVLSNDTTPCSPVTDIQNPTAAGGSTEWIFASTQAGGLSSGCAGGGCVMNFKDTPWLANTAYSVGQEILDSNLDIQVVSQAGTSGGSAPFWSKTVGGTSTDAGVHWLNQGPPSASTPAMWAPLHLYSKGAKIIDDNGNIELVTSAASVSGATSPTFSTTAGGTTTDLLLIWTNVGATPTSALATAGGTSGIIIDNTVGSGTLAGASQVYFSTLGNQTCGTSGTGGCAVQASQPALQ